ncbi:sigma-70 family RNA polymerase sigma factor [Streptomyces sp. NPDC052309]|uniref:RNA polymerase sigma factor n=1 Tax=Streptomyces sp. NPDC052309 TaxID=3155421 RepID=UPI00343CA365
MNVSAWSTAPFAGTRTDTGGLRHHWTRLLLRLSEGRRHTGDRVLTLGPTRAVPGGRHGDVTPDINDLYHHRRLYYVRLALLLVDDLPTAEDVVQDAFTAMFRRHGGTLVGLSDPEAYLRTSVVNGARSVLRRRRTARAHVPERPVTVPPADEDVLLKEEHREVLAALRSLTRRQREVLVLRYWSHLSEAQIAETLGLTRGAVKSTASRALAALGRKLEATR